MFISYRAAHRSTFRAVQAGRIPAHAKIRFKRTSVLNAARQDRGWNVFVDDGNVVYRHKPSEEEA